MAKKQVKFKVTIKEFSIEFEGEEEEGQLVQAGVTGMLDSLMHTQNRLLAIEDAEYEPVESLPAPKTKGRKAKSSSGTSKRAPRDTGRSEPIFTLKTDGWFNEKRSLADIRLALANKGFNFESKRISAIMLVLTQKGEFERAKQDGNFVYWSKAE